MKTNFISCGNGKPGFQRSSLACSILQKILALIIFSGFYCTAIAQQTCECSANDNSLTSVTLVNVNGSPLNTICSSGEVINVHIKIEFNVGASIRYGMIMLADLFINGAMHHKVGQCYPQSFYQGANTIVLDEVIPWTCGTSIALKNVFFGWENSTSKPSVCNWLNTTDKSLLAGGCTEISPHCSNYAGISYEAFAPLEASFTSNTSCGTNESVQTVSFLGHAGGGKSPYTYAWNFGDGTSSTDLSPTHTYSQTGSYNVTFTVTDSRNPAITNYMQRDVEVGSCCISARFSTQPNPIAVCPMSPAVFSFEAEGVPAARLGVQQLIDGDWHTIATGTSTYNFEAAPSWNGASLRGVIIGSSQGCDNLYSDPVSVTILSTPSNIQHTLTVAQCGESYSHLVITSPIDDANTDYKYSFDGGVTWTDDNQVNIPNGSSVDVYVKNNTTGCSVGYAGFDAPSIIQAPPAPEIEILPANCGDQFRTIEISNSAEDILYTFDLLMPWQTKQQMVDQSGSIHIAPGQYTLYAKHIGSQCMSQKTFEVAPATPIPGDELAQISGVSVGCDNPMVSYAIVVNEGPHNINEYEFNLINGTTGTQTGFTPQSGWSLPEGDYIIQARFIGGGTCIKEFTYHAIGLNYTPDNILAQTTSTPCNSNIGHINVTNPNNAEQAYKLDNGAWGDYPTNGWDAAPGSHTIYTRNRIALCEKQLEVFVERNASPEEPSITMLDAACGATHTNITINNSTDGISYSFSSTGPWQTVAQLAGVDGVINLTPGNYSLYAKMLDGECLSKTDFTILPATPIPGDELAQISGVSVGCDNPMVSYAIVVNDGSHNINEYEFNLINVTAGTQTGFSPQSGWNLPEGDYIIQVRFIGGGTCIKEFSYHAIGLNFTPDDIQISSTNPDCNSRLGHINVANPNNAEQEYKLDNDSWGDYPTAGWDVSAGMHTVYTRNRIALCEKSIGVNITAVQVDYVITYTKTDVDCLNTTGSIFNIEPSGANVKYFVDGVETATSNGSIGGFAPNSNHSIYAQIGNYCYTRSSTFDFGALPNCTQYCTKSQGFWGNNNGLEMLPSLLTTPIVIGWGSNTLTIPVGSAGTLNALMPSSGTPKALPLGNCNITVACIANYKNGERFNNTLLGQTIAVTLSGRMLANPLLGYTFTNNTSSTSNGTFTIDPSVYNYLSTGGTTVSVNSILTLANKLLGRALTPGGGVPSYGAVTSSLEAIINAFHDCATTETHCTNPTFDPIATRPACRETMGSITLSNINPSTTVFSFDDVTWQTYPAGGWTLASGTYTLRAKVDAGCSTLTTITIETAPQVPNAPQLSSTNVPCDGRAGSVTVNGSVLSSALYSFDGGSWSTTTSWSAAPGRHCVKMKIGENGCISDESCVDIERPTVLEPPVLTSTDLVCGSEAGTITINATSYNSNALFSLDGDDWTTYPVGGWAVQPGQHCVRVKLPGEGCVSSESCVVIYTSSPTPTPVICSYNVVCGATNGKIFITGTIPSGTTYSINNGPWVSYPVGGWNLPAGQYCVRAKVLNGCASAARCIRINDAPSPTPAPNVSVSNGTCGSSTGKITISPLPLNTKYSINNGPWVNYPTGGWTVAPGNYTIRALTGYNCPSPSVSVTVTAGTAPTPVLCKYDMSCNGGNGRILVTSATAGMLFSLDNGPWTAYPTGGWSVGAGMHTVKMKTSNGCISLPACVVINDLRMGNIVYSITAPTCDYRTGSVTITSPVGAGIQYSIDFGQTWQYSPVFNNIAPGTPMAILAKGRTGCRTDVQYPCMPRLRNCVPQYTKSPNVPSTNDAINVKTAELKVYVSPNPYQDRVRFTIASPISGKGTVVLSNILGQKIAIVYRGDFVANEQKTIEYLVSATQRRNLVYQVKIEGLTASGKLVSR